LRPKQLLTQVASLEELHGGALGGMADGFYVPDDTAGPAPVTPRSRHPHPLATTAKCQCALDPSPPTPEIGTSNHALGVYAVGRWLKENACPTSSLATAGRESAHPILSEAHNDDIYLRSSTMKRRLHMRIHHITQAMIALLFLVLSTTTLFSDVMGPIDIRAKGGKPEFYDTLTGKRFIPRGMNYTWSGNSINGKKNAYHNVFDPIGDGNFQKDANTSILLLSKILPQMNTTLSEFF